MNYRGYVSNLTRGVAYLRAHYGERFVGASALMFDSIAEGMRYGFWARLWGAPENAPQTFDNQAEAVKLFRFRNESSERLQGRLLRVQEYDEGGTPQKLLRSIEEWGAAIFGWSDSVTNVSMVENSPLWYEFEINIPDGRLPWLAGHPWGGFAWGDGSVWGVYSDTPEDVAALIRVIRKWKRATAIAVVTITNGANTITFKVK